jgi:hypothetical protein
MTEEKETKAVRQEKGKKEVKKRFFLNVGKKVRKASNGNCLPESRQLSLSGSTEASM